MAVTEKMNIGERFEFLRKMKAQYLGADRRTKKSLLTMMQDFTGQHRKHLIARMNSPGPSRKTRNRQRCRTHGLEVEQSIAVSARLSTGSAWSGSLRFWRRAPANWPSPTS